jgi:hypothetical protein
MNTTDTYILAGIYRPRKHGPGFGIPVFLRDGQYWVQDISSEDHVRQFVTCDVEAQTFRLPPLPTDSTTHSIGQQALYAFEAADGTLKMGTRAEVSTWLQSRVTELQATPFVLHDVAEFLGDSGLLSEAQARCDMLLQRSRQTTSAPEVPSASSGTTRTTKIQWEYDLVEKPFCAQLQTTGWQWLEGDTDVPDFTERGSFREVLLKERLAAALRRLNLRDGQP